MQHARISRTLAVLVTVSPLVWLGCGGGADLSAPELGTLEIVTTTSGPEPDADGYAISVDGAAPAPVSANATIRQAEVTAGTHTVELSGLAANCTVSGDLRVTVTVAANAVATAAFAVACSPTTGAIQVTTTAGDPADPDGYRLVVDGVDLQPIAIATTVTLPGVSPGTHSVALDGVADGCQVDGDNPRSVPVTAGDTAAVPIAVTCAPPLPDAGTLEVTTQTGGAEPDPDGYVFSIDGGTAQAIGINATVSVGSLPAGSHRVELAGAAANCGVAGNNPRTVNVPAGGSAKVTYVVTCSATSLNLRVDGWQITQSVQSSSGDVPLVADRDGFIRVFVLANQANTVTPSVRVRLFDNGTLSSTLTIPAPGPSTPQTRDEGKLSSSWNVKIPHELFRPGLTVLADVDPDNAITETDESDNSFPVTGTPQPQDVRAGSVALIRFVPVRQKANGLEGAVDASNKSTFLQLTRQIYPLPGLDGDMHAVYTTTINDALQPEDGNGAWLAILSEVDALRIAEGAARTYYGVVRVSYSSGIAGLGFVGAPTAIGYDNDPDKIRVAAHELGHTWNRLHSPCGNPGSSVDPNYPYANGRIGVFGLQLSDVTLKPPSTPDIMGYCGNPWISDYTYKGVMQFRAASGTVAALSAPAQRCLLVWGRIVDGRPVLEPAFEVLTRPSLPKNPGAYSVEALTTAGARLFDLSFDGEVVADDPHASRHFAFAVPIDEAAAADLGSLRLAGPGGAAVAVTRTPAPLVTGRAQVAVEARRIAGGTALRWDARAHPMLMVRDPETGEVLSFARGGAADIATDKAELDLVVSNQVGSEQVRVPVRP
jgi:hypothetical protein